MRVRPLPRKKVKAAAREASCVRAWLQHSRVIDRLRLLGVSLVTSKKEMRVLLERPTLAHTIDFF